MAQALAQLISKYTHLCVGSLPFQDPSKALDFISQHPFIVPFWPELPGRGEAELSLSKFERALVSKWSGYSSSEAAGLFGLLARREKSLDSLELIKGQLMGPLSGCMYALGDPAKQQDFAEAISSVRRQLIWQADQLRSLSRNVLVVLDEPGLFRWPEFSPDLKREIQSAYSYLYVTASEQNIFLGLHTCGAFLDDFISFPFDLISFDALSKPLPELLAPQKLWQDALKRHIVLAPGVYPAVTADCEAALEHGRDLFKQFQSAWHSLAGDEPVYTLQAANCGHANASLDWLNQLYSAA